MMQLPKAAPLAQTLQVPAECFFERWGIRSAVRRGAGDEESLFLSVHGVFMDSSSSQSSTKE